METVISNDDRIAIAEVDYIIHHMNERYLSKIPQKVQDYITILKKRNIEIYVDPHLPLEKQGLKEFTLYFLMILNLKYWCDDARRKDILLMMENNQKKYEEKINNIFDNAQTLQGADESEARPLNRPRQVIVTGSPTFPEKTQESKLPESSENKTESKDAETKNEETSVDAEIEKTKDAIVKVKEGNFFTKFISKIKSMLVKK